MQKTSVFAPLTVPFVQGFYLAPVGSFLSAV